jgi:hypothetical protein
MPSDEARSVLAPDLLRTIRVTDIATLIEQDHAQLDRLARALVELRPRTERWYDALAEARLTHAAHAEAEHIAFSDLVACAAVTPRLRGLVKGVAVSHNAQQRLFDQLQHPGYGDDQERTCEMLRAAMTAHSNHQRIAMWPELQRSVPDVLGARLCRTYASQRRLALAILKPRTPVVRSDPHGDLDAFDANRALTVLAQRSIHAATTDVQRDFVVFTRALAPGRRN